jgi:hypothetical protein
MKLQIRHATVIAVSLVGAMLIAFAWSSLLLPTSLLELRFRSGLSKVALQGGSSVDLNELAPTEWVLACPSHGYDEPRFVPEFNRTYPPAAPPRDGVWGLIFIGKSGEYSGVVGSCKHGGAMLNLANCVQRQQANLRLVSANGSCPKYQRE